MKAREDGDKGRGNAAMSREPPRSADSHQRLEGLEGLEEAGSVLPWSLQRAEASDTMMSGLLALELFKVPLLCGPRI